MHIILGILATVLILEITLRMLRSSSTIKPREIYELISRQELKALETQVSRRGMVHMNSFVVSGKNFCCEYIVKNNQYSLRKNGIVETIRITIPGRTGCLSALSCNDELTAWNISCRKGISIDIPDDEQWVMKQIFGMIQNAVELQSALL